MGVAGLVSVREVLELPSVAMGVPTVLAGRASLDRPVRWVHVCEQSDVTQFVDGGELVLTSGTGVAPGPAAWTALARSMTNRGAAGLIIELGVYHQSIPEQMIDEAESSGLPVVALSRPIRFVDVTRTVHERLLGGQRDQLRQRVDDHQTFSDLALAGAGLETIVGRVAAILGCPAVLEDLAHQVLAADPAGQPLPPLLRGWEQRSRKVVGGRLLDHDPEQGWLLATVGERNDVWGRLVIVLGEDSDTARARSVAELAVNTLVLRRLIDGNRETVGQQAQRTLIEDILRQSPGEHEALASRARAMGIELGAHRLVCAIVRVQGRAPATDGRADETSHVAAVERAVRRTEGLSGLVATAGSGLVVMVLAVRADAGVEGPLGEMAHAVHDRLDATIGVGSVVRGISEVERSYLQAKDAVAAASRSHRARPYYTLADTHLHGLLHLLREEPRLQAYVERELGELLRHDQRHDTDLVAVLRAFLEHRGNKSTTATTLSMSRPALYERLRRIERILSIDLDDPDIALALHVALYGLDCIRHAAR
ncbi:PucR family transcriptional regulator [Amycolatopsis taiwanensis]|uniref:PucR family transcriptional regulator n=1 Tax=Amycolatopsis taiwanensis TaxID=342230 RepID=UPI0005C1942A|nr:PucR family transcriptional regulator ligand-binding domain-containing protein [Amycolatopsis taiwanensis]